MPPAVEYQVVGAAPLSGEVGRYHIVRRLAVGGMAEVYLARVRGPHGFTRAVALKRMRPELSRQGSIQRMFADEARLAAHLHHVNIAQVHDVVEVDGESFLVMEYVDGRDVRALLDAARGRGEIGLPVEVAVAVAMGVAAGLHHAHERRDRDGRLLGIIHRDVSPSNVLVGVDGNVKLIDFGVAKARGPRDVTRAGAMKGKVPYLPPEVVRAQAVDRRGDLWSLGVTLFEMLAGWRPFNAPGEVDLLQAIVSEQPRALGRRRPGGVPARLEALVLRLLAKDPRERPETAEAVQLELEEIARAEGLAVSPLTLARHVRIEVGTGERLAVEATGEASYAPEEAHTASVSAGSYGLEHEHDADGDDDDDDDGTRPTVVDLSVTIPVAVAEPRRRRTGWWAAAAMVVGAAAIVMALGGEGHPNPNPTPIPSPGPSPSPIPITSTSTITSTSPIPITSPITITSSSSSLMTDLDPPPRPDRTISKRPARKKPAAPPVAVERDRWDEDSPLLRSQRRRLSE